MSVAKSVYRITEEIQEIKVGYDVDINKLLTKVPP